MSKTILGSLPGFVLQMLIGLILYFICLILFFRHIKPLKNFFLAVLFMYLAVVLSLTVSLPLPQKWHISAKSTAWALSQIDWIPFESAANIFHNSVRIGSFKEFFRVIGGNFILLMPLGVLVPLSNPHFHFGRMLALSLLVPTAIEGLQLLGNILYGSAIRAVETEDILLNAAGCLLAYLIFSGLRGLFRPKRKGKHYS
ncbi:VanZ family protein [Caproiciproducens faecalis]|uniref:VanZ family protein n=1 Tax=Caproiciproducens faecalis TaxID=2820301 RepID=A0ABS7DQH3_9FIRM|nr:VanZ family protein [Caproiciproducens faecalis]MBW7573559.1 VanZ family protein [Caproiciproducens faecalis]